MYIGLSLKKARKSLTEDWSPNIMFTELLKKATTAETVTETEKMTNRKLKN